MSEMTEFYKQNIKHRQSMLKKRYGERVWICTGCEAVMGMFDEEYCLLTIDSQNVYVDFKTGSGGLISRTCKKCNTKNDLTTRPKNQSIKEWKALNQHKLAIRKD